MPNRVTSQWKSTVTVKLHVKTLYRKIEARNRTHAAMIAKEAGLF